MVDVNPEIFKAYDIRGLYGTEMDETTAHAIGRAFARVLGRLRDKATGRAARRARARYAADGAGDGGRGPRRPDAEGVTVLDAGMVATEMLYHLVGSRELDGGAMVTASHNPKAYTGVKLVREGALALSGEAGIGDVRREIEAGLGEEPGGGTSEDVDIWDEYHEHALSFIDPVEGDADEARRRRRQRHGGPDGRPDSGEAAARARGDVLHARR